MEDPEVQRNYRSQSNQPWLKTNPDELRKRLAYDAENWNRVLGDIGNIQ